MQERWKQRLKGLLVGSIALLVINIFSFVFFELITSSMFSGFVTMSIFGISLLFPILGLVIGNTSLRRKLLSVLFLVILIGFIVSFIPGFKKEHYTYQHGTSFNLIGSDKNVEQCYEEQLSTGLTYGYLKCEANTDIEMLDTIANRRNGIAGEVRHYDCFLS